MAGRRKAPETGTLHQRNTAANDQFRAEQRKGVDAEGQAVTWKQGADLEQFRKDAYKEALADAKAARK